MTSYRHFVIESGKIPGGLLLHALDLSIPYSHNLPSFKIPWTKKYLFYALTLNRPFIEKIHLIVIVQLKQISFKIYKNN